MRKSKAKSKPKAKEGSNSKLNEPNQQEIQSKCAVCRSALKAEHIMMTCEDCKKTTHAACYNGDFPSSKKNFTCDTCKNKKRKEHCVICRQFGETEMLKILERTNSYVHVQCAILSPSVEIESYSKLGLISVGGLQRGNKQLVNCSACGELGTGVMIQCVVCPKKAHFRCWIVEFGDSRFFYLISRWLDKCEKNDFLLHWVFSKKKTNLKSFVDLSSKAKDGQLAVCQDHSEDYSFCYCGNEELSKNKVHSDYQCDQCQRWIHQLCSGLPPESGQNFVCSGCKEKNKFKKEIKFHELLASVSAIQKMEKFDDQSIRLLNAFPFKYSGILQKKIIDNLRQIQIYFAKKQVVKLASGDQIEEKKKKKLIELLFIIQFGDKWKQRGNQIQKDPAQWATFLDSIRNVFPKQIEEKIYRSLKPNTSNNTVEFDLFKEQLKNFIKQWKGQAVSKIKDSYLQLAIALKQLQTKFVNAFENSQEGAKFIVKFNEVMGNKLFGMIIGQKTISKDLIMSVLKRYSKIRHYKGEDLEMKEEEYFSILNQKDSNSHENEKKEWKQLIGQLKTDLNSVPIAFESIEKEKKFKKWESQLKQNKNNGRILAKVTNQSLKDQVCMVNSQNFMSKRLKSIQENALKKKIIRMVSKKDHQISEENLKDGPLIQEFLKKNFHLFTESEIIMVNNYIGKVQFLNKIFQRGEYLQHYLICDETPIENGSEPGQRTGVIFLRLLHMLDNWDQKILQAEYFLNEMYYKCVLKKVKFDNPLVEKRLRAFVMFLSNRYINLIDEGRRIHPQTLRKLVKILEYWGIQKDFPFFLEMFEKVKRWMTILTEENSDNLPFILQKHDKVLNLMKVLDLKIGTAFEIENVSMNTEISKLCLLRQWCRLSEKISLLFKSKATINSIQTLKGYVQKSCYPSNSLLKKVIELDLQSRNLNREVVKFLQKPRISSEHIGFFDELKFIAFKMTIEEGYSIKSLLEKSNLDVYVETQQLENEIRQFESLPSQLGSYSEKNSIAELKSTRRKLIDSCFRISKIEEYQKFLRKIYVTRCLNFEPPTTREEYFQLLTVGGAAAIELESKTTDLIKAYKAIQKAENELANQMSRKRIFGNLIPFSDQKYRQLKEALKDDPMELNKLKKARMNNERVREEYMELRTRKVEIERYREIEYELSNSIFNNSQIINEILALRNEVERMVRRVQQVLPYSHANPQLQSYENIFKRDRAILDAFCTIKIKHPTLEKFEYDCRLYHRAEQIRQEMTPETYRQYCDTCSQISEMGCKIPQFLQTRSNEYIEMFRDVMASGEPSMLLCQTLITQGLELRRLGSSQKELIFDMVIQIFGHLREGMQENAQGRGQENVDQSESDGEIDEVSDQDDEDEEDIDVDVDVDDEESSESSPTPPPKPRGGNNQIILDSD